MQVSYCYRTTSGAHHECMIDKIWPSIFVGVSFYFSSCDWSCLFCLQLSHEVQMSASAVHLLVGIVCQR